MGILDDLGVTSAAKELITAVKDAQVDRILNQNQTPLPAPLTTSAPNYEYDTGSGVSPMLKYALGGLAALAVVLLVRK